VLSLQELALVLLLLSFMGLVFGLGMVAGNRKRN
jgi:hypothetical protein